MAARRPRWSSSLDSEPAAVTEPEALQLWPESESQLASEEGRESGVSIGRTGEGGVTGALAVGGTAERAWHGRRSAGGSRSRQR